MKTAALAVQQHGNGVLVQVPAGTLILVTSTVPAVDSLDRDPKVNVEWDGQTATMFAVDIQERGERILAASG